LVELTCPEAHDGAREVPDGPDEPPPEAVVGAAAPFGEQTRGGQLLLGEVLVAQVPAQVVPALGGIADAELFGCGAVEAPLGEELPGLLGFGGGQLLLEVLGGSPVSIQEALAAAHVGTTAVASPVVFVAQLHPGLPREGLDRFGEAEVVDLLHEGDDVAALAATEAVPQAQVGAHVERGGAFVVEGAQTLHRAHARSAQGHVLADDLIDAGSFSYCCDVVTSNEPGHEESLGRVPRPFGIACGPAESHRPRSRERRIARWRCPHPARTCGSATPGRTGRSARPPGPPPPGAGCHRPRRGRSLRRTSPPEPPRPGRRARPPGR